MKVGNLVGGLEVVDVKRVNKLNLIQFLKDVDGYLQQGYRIDVNSARQVGLVLQADVYKTEEPSSQKVGSVSSVEPKSKQVEVEEIKVDTATPKETEAPVEGTVVEPEKPVKKHTTTRSKKTAQ